MMSNDKRGIPYEFLIDIYEKSAGQRDVILKEVKNSYPEVYIGSPDCFYNTIKRIVSPTVPSILNGKIAVKDDALKTYKKRTWIPKIRNTSISKIGIE